MDNEDFIFAIYSEYVKLYYSMFPYMLISIYVDITKNIMHNIRACDTLIYVRYIE